MIKGHASQPLRCETKIPASETKANIAISPPTKMFKNSDANESR